MKRPTFKEFKKKALADKGTRKAYKKLEEEFALISAQIGAKNKARKKHIKRQALVAL